MDFFLRTMFGMFLYFPEDKSEYIPAAITFGIVLLMAIGAMIFIIKHSKKEAAKYKEWEEKQLRKEVNKK